MIRTSAQAELAELLSTDPFGPDEAAAFIADYIASHGGPEAYLDHAQSWGRAHGAFGSPRFRTRAA